MLREREVATTPQLTASGKPFKTERAAATSAKQRGLDLVPVPVEGGWGLASRDQAPITAERQRVIDAREDLLAIAQDAGRSEAGGKLIRDEDGNVSGRTVRVNNAPWAVEGSEESPQVLRAHIEAYAAGEYVPAKSRRTIEGMLEWLDEQRGSTEIAPEDRSSFELEEMGYAAAPEPVQQQYDALDDFLADTAPEQTDTAAQMRAMGFTEQEIESEIRREAEARAGSTGEHDTGRAQATGPDGSDTAASEARAGREAGGEGQVTRAPWQMTSAEFAQAELDQNEYKAAYEGDPELKAEFLQNQLIPWRRALEQAGRERVLPDRVLDDYVCAVR